MRWNRRCTTASLGALTVWFITLTEARNTSPSLIRTAPPPLNSATNAFIALLKEQMRIRTHQHDGTGPDDVLANV